MESKFTAAPDLLKALEDSLQIMEQTLVYRNANGLSVGNVFLTSAISQAKAAIEKAKGS